MKGYIIGLIIGIILFLAFIKPFEVYASNRRINKKSHRVGR